MSNKKVPDLCSELNSIIININNQSSLLVELFVPNSQSSSGSSGISCSKSLIPSLERMIEIGGRIQVNLYEVIKNVESTRDKSYEETCSWSKDLK